MTLELDKLICLECYTHFTKAQQLSAPHPFDEGSTCNGCPSCHSIDRIQVGCDEPGCREVGSCGTPSKLHRYRHTCHKHIPKE